MRLRPALLTGFAVAMATTSVATAAPKPIKYCNVLSDEKGDGASDNFSFMESAALDIVSGDIATDKTKFAAVLRLAGNPTASDNWAFTGGYGWSMGATLSGVDYAFTYYRPAFNGQPRVSASVGNATPKYTFKVEGNNLVWRINRADLPSLNKKPGQKFGEFRATSETWGSTADTATEPGKTYPDKGLSCVKL